MSILITTVFTICVAVTLVLDGNAFLIVAGEFVTITTTPLFVTQIPTVVYPITDVLLRNTFWIV